MARNQTSIGTIHPVILSGGSGMRLWPLSRTHYPKQLMALAGQHSMLQETAMRVARAPFAAPVVVCNDEHLFAITEQLREADATPQAIIIEPVGRNTAPAAAVAALYLVARDPDAVMLVLPSDHVVDKPQSFRNAVVTGLAAARDGALVTFGITPERAETGYGYVRHGTPWKGAPGCFQAAQFIEKPNASVAQAYIDDGAYHWNSGIFLFRAQRYLEELSNACPEIDAACRHAFNECALDCDTLHLDAEAFTACPSLSIDHAVMEPSERAAVVPVDMGWSDVGSWNSLWEVGDKDGHGNLLSGDVLVHNVRGSLIRAQDRLVAAVGIDDLVVVATADAVLVTRRDRAQEVKHVVEALKADRRPECHAHPVVHRPWGHFQTVDRGVGFQVKHIMVKPGAKLSLQLHYHRAEHWVVVSGIAKVTLGDDTLTLTANQSTYIPPETKHRLENTGETPLRVIEVQSGHYLGEDDIVRFDDVYGRD
jgi:mannose-1-phosphate guanylyltransferase/mannose-6-phosphate isomerase